jgi:hypothetical protein
MLMTHAGCVNDVNGRRTDTVLYLYSFENDMQGWRSFATDVSNPSVRWEINPSTSVVKAGSWALKFELDNMTDAGKIWIERSFQVRPLQKYRVDIEFEFASADYGDMNLWKILAGVKTSNARKSDDLIFREDTGNRADRPVGFVWQKKSYSAEITSAADGALFVHLGVWGTWETARNYYVDLLCVSITGLE